MGGIAQIKLKKSVVDNLKVCKSVMGCPTYSDVIAELIRLANSKENIEKVSNQEIVYIINKFDKKIASRVEALHTRIGYFEKDYFLKIPEIFDSVDAKTLRTKFVNEPKESDKSIDKNEEALYRQKIENLQKSHLELENFNEDLNRKVNLIKSKLFKKSGVFASGYEITLSEEEYNSIFK